MLRSLLSAACGLAFGLAAQAGEGQVAHEHESPAGPSTTEAEASAEIVSGSGDVIGTAGFVQGPHGVLMTISIGPGGLEPGWHGIHLHEKGDCSDIGTFTNSGGHHGKAEGRHGLMNPAGPEMGDLPNIWAGADGSAGYEAFSALFELAGALEGDGIALVIHANRDDHLTQPIGGAGPRVACGVVTAPSP